MKRTQIGKALEFLKTNNHSYFSPTHIKQACGLSITTDTISRKLRYYAAKGDIIKSYIRSNSGEEIAVYAGKVDVLTPRMVLDSYNVVVFDDEYYSDRDL